MISGRCPNKEMTMLLKLLKVAMIGAPAGVIAGCGMALIEFGEVYIGLSLVLP